MNASSGPNPTRASNALGLLLLIPGLFLAQLNWLSTANAETTSPAIKTWEESLLIVEVHLDQSVISDALTLYHLTDDSYLPLAELGRVAGLAIELSADQSTLSGWIIEESRRVEIHLKEGTGQVDGKTIRFDPKKIHFETRFDAKDAYVPQTWLSQWFPLDFELETHGLVLTLKPRETLPIQSRLERMRIAHQLNSNPVPEEAPRYTRVENPYQPIQVPFVDQKFGMGYSQSHGASLGTWDYSTYATGDLIGLESSLFLSGNRTDPVSDSRLLVGRTDPDAELLGPLHARTVTFGAVTIPGLPSLATPNASGTGFLISNRPFSHPAQFDTYSLNGALQTGWDVLVYFNGAPIRYQPPRDDGRYQFDDLPLLFGLNDYRLVFSGPLGERREEHYRFFLDGSLLQPGQFFYDLGMNHTAEGRTRTTFLLERSVLKNTSVSFNFLGTPLGQGTEHYEGLGLRAYFDSLFLSFDTQKQNQAGSLYSLSAKSQLGAVTYSISDTVLNDFTSETYQPSSDPVVNRASIRTDFSVPFPARMPLSVQANRDWLRSGLKVEDLRLQMSSFLYGISFSDAFQAQHSGDLIMTSNTLVLSKMLGRFNLKGQADYKFAPNAGWTNLNIEGTHPLATGTTLNETLTHTFDDDSYRVSLGLNRNIGKIGIGTSLAHSTLGETSVTFQLFTGLSFDPGEKKIYSEAAPIAQNGAASAHVFYDENQNGRFDPGEPPIPGAGFVLGAGDLITAKTDEKGIAFLNHLPTREPVSIALDPKTLEDLDQYPRPKGWELVPRSGHAGSLEFPVILASEVEGQVYIRRGNQAVPAADVQLEMVGVAGKQVEATTHTASDGYFSMPHIPAGQYEIRLNSEQANRLHLEMAEPKILTIQTHDHLISAGNLTLKKSGDATQ